MSGLHDKDLNAKCQTSIEVYNWQPSCVRILSNMFDIAFDSMGIDRARVLMVGDRVTTDIIGARQAGIPSVLVKTGEFKESDLIGDVQPDYMVNSINEIETFF